MRFVCYSVLLGLLVMPGPVCAQEAQTSCHEPLGLKPCGLQAASTGSHAGVIGPCDRRHDLRP